MENDSLTAEVLVLTEYDGAVIHRPVSFALSLLQICKLHWHDFTLLITPSGEYQYE